jgi:hypothetical protein
MKIAFLGYGGMAEALASNWVGRHELCIGGRHAEKARALAEKLGGEAKGIAAADARGAVAFGEVVVPATPHDAVFDAIEAAGGASAFASKIVVDINNPYDRETSLNKTYEGRSLAEAIARAVPDAHVVKAFNMAHTSVWKMDDPSFDGRRLVTMYCGDDEGAKAQVAQLIRDVGAEPLDLGGLRYARLLEPAAAIVIKLLFSGRDLHTVLNVIAPESKPI